MSKAVVVFSGGQDSTTCLYWAKQQFKEVYTLSFMYGQRHQVELQAAARIAELASVPHHVIDIKAWGAHVGSALTDQAQKVCADGGLGDLPSTFVPGRNLVFLTMAAGIAVSLGARHLVTGVCQTDYSGYPDCRHETIQSLQEAINLGLPGTSPVHIHTPLMWLTKAETVTLASKLPGCMEALALSVTCYEGQVPGCGQCPACKLRSAGFAQAGVPDPAR